MKRKKKNQDDFQYISECIQEIYDYCMNKDISLEFIKIIPVDISESKELDDYYLTQLLWEKAETFEIMEYLNPNSTLYKGKPITKSEILDTIIDISIETDRDLKKKKK